MPDGRLRRAAGNDDLTLVKEMIALPNASNMPEDVTFDLPTDVAYTEPSDLYYMPLTDLASLIQSQTVSCVTVVTAFKDRLEVRRSAAVTAPLSCRLRRLPPRRRSMTPTSHSSPRRCTTRRSRPPPSTTRSSPPASPRAR